MWNSYEYLWLRPCLFDEIDPNCQEYNDALVKEGVRAVAPTNAQKTHDESSLNPNHR